MPIKYIFYDWLGLNSWLFSQINSLSGGVGYDQFMLHFTALGEQHFFPLYVMATAAVLALCVLARGFGRPWPVVREELRPAMALLCTLVVGYAFCFAIMFVLKEMFAMPRPFVAFRQAGFAVHIPVLPPPEKYYESFPSGHAAMVTFLVTAWWPHLARPFQTLVLVFLGLMCWSRIAVGMHFPVDVLAGACIGGWSAAVTRHYVYHFWKAR